ncbi:COX15/CtaA family protein [Alteromonas halophila]|uniref:Heme A synthase n=1 Tax=Alteromonas halophila TaxID=516698 RepID=A0A918JPH5_9ALTE|nr:COX15/CtaA family protein [Alteromonas halophila]GGW91140.1 heme A synthase [Alteromonas halophila]
MKKLAVFSLALAFVVIILGAYTRLTDAGLGCPDWPGCYGHIGVPQQAEHVAAANAAFPDRPVEAHKAWNEMIHRYFAGTLGLCILAIAIIALVKREPSRPLKLPLALLGLVIFQAALGMWTVTLNLLPVVVMGHLLGGFTVLACLFVLYLRLADPHRSYAGLPLLAAGGIVVLIVQIALGGWTSANYAALACTEFPVCEGQWWSRLDFGGAYSVPPADNYEFGAHDYAERMTMHIVHRIGAVVTFFYLGFVALRLLGGHSRVSKTAPVVLLAVLFLQVGLGISNVVFSLPLFVAVAHNAVAACLLLVMIWITWQLSQAHGGSHG